MANVITNTFSAVKTYFKEGFDDAPPSVRYYDEAFMPLYRPVDGGREFIGSFAPELYDLANAGMLREQLLEQQYIKIKYDGCMPAHLNGYIDQLNRDALTSATAREVAKLYVGYRRKTPTELAFIPSKEVLEVERVFLQHIHYLRDKQLPVSPMVPKFTMGYYLAKIKAAGLETEFGPSPQATGFLAKLLNKIKAVVSPQEEDMAGIGIKLNVVNPLKTRTTREKILHYAAEWTAFILTICTVLTVEVIGLSLGLSPAFAAILSMGAAYVANDSGNKFGTFDTAEELNRFIGFMSNKQLWQGKLHPRKALKTFLYMSAILAFTGLSTAAATMAMLNLPVAGLTAWGLSNGLASASITFAATITGIATALMSLTGKGFAVRYFRGISPYDTQVPFDNAEVIEAIKKMPGLAFEKKACCDCANEAEKEAVAANDEFALPKSFTPARKAAQDVAQPAPPPVQPENLSFRDKAKLFSM